MGSVLQFPGTEGQQVDLAVSPPINASFTLEFWTITQPEVVTSGAAVCPVRSQLRDAGSGHAAFRIWLIGDYCATALWRGVPLFDVRDTPLLPAAQWSHIVIIWDAVDHRLRLLINGAERHNGVVAGADDLHLDALEVGAKDRAEAFRGVVWNLRLWDHARADALTAAACWRLLPDDTPGLVVNAPLQPGTRGVPDPLDSGRWLPAHTPAEAGRGGPLPVDPPAPPWFDAAQGRFLELRQGQPHSLPLPGDLAGRSFTAELWIFPRSAAGDQHILMGGGRPSGDRDATHLGHLHCILRGGALYLGFYFSDVAGSERLPLHTWSHVVFRYDAASQVQTLLLNGVPCGSRAAAPPLRVGAPLRIGGWAPGADGTCEALLTRLRVWEGALEDAQLRALLFSTTPTLPLITAQALHPEAPELAALPADRWSAAAPPLGPWGTGAPALRLGAGELRSFEAAPSLEAAGAFTVAAWLRPEAADTDLHLSAPLHRGFEGAGWALRATNGQVEWTVVTEAPHSIRWEAGGPLGWVAVAGVFDQGRMALFVNGVEVADRTLTPAAHRASTGPLHLGGGAFAGAIAAIAAWPRALGAAELAARTWRLDGLAGSGAALRWCAGEEGVAAGPGALEATAPGAWAAPVAAAVAATTARAAADSEAQVAALLAQLEATERRLADAGASASHDRAQLQAQLDAAAEREAAAHLARAEAEGRAEVLAGQLAAREAEAQAQAEGVSMQAWLVSLAAQVDSARRQIGALGGLRLGAVELDFRVRPGAQGTTLFFPSADELDRLPAGQGSSLRLSLEPESTHSDVPAPPVPVPAVVGLSRSLATEKARAAGLEVDVLLEILAPENAHQHGRVLDQSPAAGSAAPPGKTLTLTLGQAG